MQDVELTAAELNDIMAHAVEAYPNECCGLVIRRHDRREVVRGTNIQQTRHAEDPERFPRTGTTGYTMGPDVLPLLLGHDRGDLVIEAIYHSHPRHDAYFSAEDRMQALFGHEPAYPNVAQIVVSVYDGHVKEMKAYRWNDNARQFVEASLHTRSVPSEP
jgi:[CysO sulfur-carrier protein]-S-L-cysteine hydrolase